MITCPRCGASNPKDHRFCGQCGQLLQAATAAPAETPANELPAWLSDLGVSDEPPPAKETAQTPDWLAQLQQEAPAEPAPADDLPDWLRSEVETKPAASAPALSSGDALPDWLREIEAEAAPAPAAQPPVRSSDDTPPWLRDEQPTASAPAAPIHQPPADDLPDWLREVESETPTASAPASQPISEGLPDWLREVEPPQRAAALAPSVSDDLPPWLRDDQFTASAPTAPAAPPPSNALPDWLSEVEAETSSPSGVAASAPPSGNELPDWLREVETETPSSTSAPALPPAPDELPDWLREIEAEPASAAAPRQSAAGELPAWLHDDQPVASSGASFAAPAQQRDDAALPSWLADAPPSQPGALSDATTQALDVPLPDWSSEFGAPSDATTQQATDELPAWLQESSPVASSAPSSDLAAPGWLQAETPPATYETQPLPVADELPAWLAADSADQQSSPPPSNPATTQALPSWLLDQPAQTSESAPSSVASAADQDLPPWLQSTDEPAPASGGEGLPSWLALPDEPADAPSAARASEPSGDPGLPAWLSDQSDAPSATKVSDTGSDAGLPAWLSDQSDAPSATKIYDAPADSGLPAWLSDQSDEAPSVTKVYDAPEASATTTGGADTVQLPAWLAGEADQTSAPATAASQPADADLPPWLSGMGVEDAPPASSSATSALPSWLEEPEQPAATSAAPTAPQSEFLGGLDLPAWLRAEQEQPEAAAKPAAEPAPTWLQRVTPEGDEPVATAIAPETSAAPRIKRSEDRVAAMQLLEQLVASPAAEPLPQPVQKRRSWLLPVLLVLALALIVGGILFVLLNPRLGLNFGAAPVAVPAASAAVQTIAALPANKPVMLAYEWDTQRLAELGVLEDAVVGQLVQRSDVPLVLLSTDPQGALLAGERADQLLSSKDGFHDQYGLGFVNLGFKAGGPIALHRFADNTAFGELFAQDAGGRDLRGEPVVMQSICGAETAADCAWDKVGALVIMADEVEDVRGWFEQVRSAHPALPTLLLTPAELAPQVQPYAATGNTVALSGLAAAQAYNQVRGIDDERLGRQVDATAVGGALFSALALIGAAPAYITGRRARQAREDDQWAR